MNTEKNCWWFIVAQGQILLQPQGDFVPYGNLEDLPLTESLVTEKIKIGDPNPSIATQTMENIEKQIILIKSLSLIKSFRPTCNSL